MRFGEIPVSEAAGTILAHSRTLPGRALKKGRLLSEEDVRALTDAGVRTIVAAQLDSDDVREDEPQLVSRSAPQLGSRDRPQRDRAEQQSQEDDAGRAELREERLRHGRAALNGRRRCEDEQDRLQPVHDAIVAGGVM